MLGEERDVTKHIHLQWFAKDDEAGASAGANQSAGETSEDKAGDSRGDASASGADEKGAEQAPKTVSAEEHAKVKAEYERILGIFKEKESKEKRQRDEALRTKGEFEKLYSVDHADLEILRPRLERVSAVVQALLDAELQGLPKDFDESLLPAGDADQKLDWITKAKKAGLLTEKTPQKKAGDGTPPQRGAASEGLMAIYKKQQ